MIRRLLCWLGWHQDKDWQEGQLSIEQQYWQDFAAGFVNSYDGFTATRWPDQWLECKHCGIRRR